MWLENIYMIPPARAWAEYYQNWSVANVTTKMALAACMCTHLGGSTIKNWILHAATTSNIMEAWECRATVLDLECKTPTENILVVMVNKKMLVAMALH